MMSIEESNYDDLRIVCDESDESEFLTEVQNAD